jgi:hypothetical protein
MCDRSLSWQQAFKCCVEKQFFCRRNCYTCYDSTSQSRDDCSDLNHKSCWDAHLPDNKLKDGHRRIDVVAEMFIRCATHSESDAEQQRLLHERDGVARWFDLDHELKRLRIYNRFTQLCDPDLTGNMANSNQYPCLVSFIGNTMAGKSSLIRAMIALSKMDIMAVTATVTDDAVSILSGLEQAADWGPVTRSAILSDITKPTSRGVHLYKGNNSTCTASDGQERLLLFADCEGFGGGNQQTNSEKYGNLSRARDRVRSRSPLPKPERDDDDPTTKYHLQPAFDEALKASSYSEKGKVGVELFYARFLYAMSNVLVYVIESDGRLQKSMTELFEWASSAVFRSINNPSRKTLIIVRHKATPHDDRLYDEKKLEETFLKELHPLWEGEPTLKAFVDRYNSQQIFQRKIRNNDHLFRMFFDEIKFCYVPDRKEVSSHPEKLFQQYRQLARQIGHAAHKAEHGATHSWKNYNVPTFNRVLKLAFDHFSVSDLPFDFCKAARNDYSTPNSPTDHFASFMRQLFRYRGWTGSTQVVELLSKTLAISLVIRELRLKKLGKLCLSPSTSTDCQ